MPPKKQQTPASNKRGSAAASSSSTAINQPPTKKQKQQEVNYRIEKIERVLQKSEDELIKTMLQECCKDAFIGANQDMEQMLQHVAAGGTASGGSSSSSSSSAAPGSSLNLRSSSIASQKYGSHGRNFEYETLQLIYNAINDLKTKATIRKEDAESLRSTQNLEKDDVKHKLELLAVQSNLKKEDLKAALKYEAENKEKRKKMTNEAKKAEKQVGVETGKLQELKDEIENCRKEYLEFRSMMTVGPQNAPNPIPAAASSSSSSKKAGNKKEEESNPARKMVHAFLKKLKLEDSLMSAAPKALEKKPHDRSKFESAAIEAVKVEYETQFLPKMQQERDSQNEKLHGSRAASDDLQSQLSSLNMITETAIERVQQLTKEADDMDDIATDLEQRAKDLKKSFSDSEKNLNSALLDVQEAEEALTFLREVMNL
ncbi:unnamed protein product [Amoebophrya sp. A120]|nr:unnamed protein product [Amoebophrya sp. A120]|eukprot:GSA120T00014081001.1